MFTGIATHIGRVRSVRRTNRDLRLEIESDLNLADAPIGASILHNGCCLTLVAKGEGRHEVEVSDETLRCATLGAWTSGTRINLERPQKVGDDLGGHIVTGHVDAAGEVLSVVAEGGSHLLTISVPAPLHRFIAHKGSVAVDGVSLTVVETGAHDFTVCVIPHTWEVTTLGQLQPGDAVNIETDVLSRYLARWVETADGSE